MLVNNQLVTVSPLGEFQTTLNLGIQYWTSRGFAVLDVNYGGSTGYGRSYRERLNGQWRIVDVQDCLNGALYLVQQGLADANKLAIRGGSAITLPLSVVIQIFEPAPIVA